jgi:superfamily II DNA or RNA helicase
MLLRPYQTDAITKTLAAWQQHTDVLGVAATGAGKTVIFISLLTQLLTAGKRGVVLAHREELIEQPIERLRAIAGDWLMTGTLERPRVGRLLGEQKDYDRQLTVATVQALSYRRKGADGQWTYPHLDKLLQAGPIDYLITDEAHHAISPSYLEVVARLRAANPALRHLGVTATPQRGDGKAMANGFTTTAFTVTIADLVRQGYLVKPSWLAISTQIDLSGVKTTAGDFQQNQLAERFDTEACRAVVVAAHKEYAPDRPAIAFTVSVQGAYDLAEAFRAAGFSAAAADGTTDKAVRRQILVDFRAGKYQVLVNCGLWTEGLDVPEIAAIHLARPTRSDGLYIQMVGRGLRPVPGKDDCVILDYLPADARNVAMLGDILGCPIPRDELLKSFKKNERQPSMMQIGFTFDGDTFDANGLDLQIVAKELHYLEASIWTWHRRDGLLTLGCGRGSDGKERILAIKDGQLWGIWRDGQQQSDGSWRGVGTWAARPIAATDPFASGEALAAKHATQELVAKGRGWHKAPISEGQAKWLYGLVRGELKHAEINALTKGQAAGLITHYQATQAIGRYEAALQSQMIEVA